MTTPDPDLETARLAEQDAVVDEASAESMICSDPPAYGGLHAGAPAPVEPLDHAPLDGGRAGRRRRVVIASATLGALALATTAASFLYMRTRRSPWRRAARALHIRRA